MAVSTGPSDNAVEPR